MNWRIPATLAAIAILPLGANAVLAQNNLGENTTMERSHHKHGMKGERGMRGGANRLLEQLDLTSEQSEQIEAIQEQSETENQALFEQLQTNHQQMQSLLSSNANSEELRANHQQEQNLRQQLGNNRFETMLEIREVLTPEQRTQMTELMEKKGRKFGDRN